MKRSAARFLCLLSILAGALGLGVAPTLNATAIDWAAYDPATNGTYEFVGSLDGHPATIEIKISNVGKEPGTYIMEMAMDIPAIRFYEATTIQVEHGVYNPSSLLLDDLDINFDQLFPEHLELRHGIPIDWASNYDYWNYQVGEIK